MLLSDINDMTENLAKEFSDIISVRSIGNTWEGRPINIIELDARELMKSKGIEEDVVEAPPVAKKAVQTNATKDADDDSDSTKDESYSKKKVEDLSEQELLEKNEDIRRTEDKKAKAKNDEYNAIP